MKKYLDITVTRVDGTTFTNPLMLSEYRIIFTEILKDNKSISVKIALCTKEYYKQLFGY